MTRRSSVRGNASRLVLAGAFLLMVATLDAEEASSAAHDDALKQISGAEVLTPAVRELIARAAGAGLPDLQGATVWNGAWLDDPLLHDPYRRMGGEDFGFGHVHIRLADGRWLMRGFILRPAASPAPV